MRHCAKLQDLLDHVDKKSWGKFKTKKTSSVPKKTSILLREWISDAVAADEDAMQKRGTYALGWSVHARDAIGFTDIVNILQDFKIASADDDWTKNLTFKSQILK